MSRVLYVLDNLESYICRSLLVTFVCLLFAQILSREIFNSSISWIEELSVYLFVWFVYIGASYAARKHAHNRVTFQFRFFGKRVVNYIEAFADLFWIFFNVVFIYLSSNFVFFQMNKFWKSQTLGIEMKWIYIVLPISFTLITIRVIQVNYLKLVKGVDFKDVDSVDLEEIARETAAAGVASDIAGGTDPRGGKY